MFNQTGVGDPATSLNAPNRQGGLWAWDGFYYLLLSTQLLTSAAVGRVAHSRCVDKPASFQGTHGLIFLHILSCESYTHVSK